MHCPPYPDRCSFHADPSGTFVRYDAKAIGSGSEGAQSELQDKYTKVGLTIVTAPAATTLPRI